MKVLAQNRRAAHKYELERTLEAGIELTGGEVKSIKASQVSIAEAYVQVRKGQAFLMAAYVKPYAASDEPADPNRPRKLLLHQEEIAKLAGEAKAGGRTIVPTKVYTKQALIKVEIAVGRGKQAHDKRETLKRRQQEREAQAAVKQARQ